MQAAALALLGADPNACAIGFARSSSSSECEPCPPGQSTRFPGDPRKCQPCNPGQFSAKPGGACLGCDYGKFSDAAGATACTGLCEPGSSTTAYGAAGPDKCVPCSAGTANAVPGEPCRACEAGKFAPPGSQYCEVCEPGWSTEGKTGSATCRRCKPGTYAAAAGTQYCTECPRSTFGNVAGAPSRDAGCRPCPAGHETDGPGKSSHSACTRCAVGSHIWPGLDACAPCPRGTYHDHTSDKPGTGCVPCPPGARFSAPGSTSTAQCSAVPWDEMRMATPVAAALLLCLCLCLCLRRRPRSLEGDDMAALFAAPRDWPSHKHLHQL